MSVTYLVFLLLLSPRHILNSGFVHLVHVGVLDQITPTTMQLLEVVGTSKQALFTAYLTLTSLHHCSCSTLLLLLTYDLCVIAKFFAVTGWEVCSLMPSIDLT